MTTRAGHTAEEQLREALAKPVFNAVLKTWVGVGTTDYEVYLRTGELLSLQTATGELTHPDELMFQIVHQAQEVWLKLLAHELAGIVGEVDRDELWEASARLDRTIRIADCLAREIGVLETMTPDTYQTIRRSLGKGSGQESPGYNAVHTAAEQVEAALDRLLDRRGVRVAQVYAANAQPELKRVCELLVDIDERFQQWLIAHFMLVRRTIGVGRGVNALDGVPTKVLTGRMTKPLFRSLWQVRSELTENWSSAGGYAPGASRESTAR
ncbi:tryptophan 2,3-dioxygenase [Nocardia tenerifensis]|uniref:Tryptophan 2,3-dioxygenase n=1 Tax=Nocardia tenerifensis TaxID=228006 RepID=A0A318K359_9NOCA|nr:tryptophan 2,3-dioxygenase family protein [Nocardia tenerifensis]PXX56353.1 tryptophan 2,3-dioxygenase [Nocardia tenerifensis]